MNEKKCEHSSCPQKDYTFQTTETKIHNNNSGRNPKFYSIGGPAVLMFHHGFPPKYLPLFKCLKSILFIFSYVYVLRHSCSPAGMHFASIHASLTTVLKSLNCGEKSSGCCTPEQERRGRVSPLPVHHAIQISGAGASREANAKEADHSVVR